MKVQRITQDNIAKLLPKRPLESHKGDYGKLLLLCGSKGYTGAPALAAMGALRSGAGLVYLAVPECIYTIEAIKVTEPVVMALQSDDLTFSREASDSVLQLLMGKDAVLIGPGIGCSEGTISLLKTVLTQFDGPVVIDADGINLLQQHKNLLRERTAPTILTPHMGEFMRIGGNMDMPRCEAAAVLARDLGAIVALKGHETVITDGESCYINSTGNPGMAVGGSGDVLAGIITALLGQKLPPLLAAACGVWLHGAAGDICATEIGEYGMLPTDVLAALPRLLF